MNFIIQYFVDRKLAILSNLPSFRVLFSDFVGKIKDLSKMKVKELFAFTYAELMIVMGVLGIVATHTIPMLYADYERNLTLVKLQRAYAIFSGGINLAINENGSPDVWGLVGPADATGLSNINKVLSQYFKVNQNCNLSAGCFPDTNYKNMKGVDGSDVLDQDADYTKLRLADGTSVAVTQLNNDCSLNWGNGQLANVCGLVLMDINGGQSPNTFGQDLFGFALTKTGLVPLGSQMQTNGYPFSGFCSQNSNANFKYENGMSCTAWALYNNNMDYLDCKGLNWNNGKTSCNG